MAIEVPEFVNGKLIERIHGRTRELSEEYEGKIRRGRTKREIESFIQKGENMAKRRAGVLLAVLDYGANHLQKLNDAQKARFRANEQEIDYQGPREFSEYSLWREAYCVVDERRPVVDYVIFRWLFAAVAEATGV